jgi:hypothetical protein
MNMSSNFKKIAITSVGLLFVSHQALSCTLTPLPRQQVRLDFEYSSLKNIKAPKEFNLQQGDLITMTPPVKGSVQIIEVKNTQTDVPVLKSIGEEQYQELSQLGKNHPLWVNAGGLYGPFMKPEEAKKLGLARYGAGGYGIAYMKIISGNQFSLIRMNVEKLVEPTRDYQRRVTEKDMGGDPVLLDYYATLEIELPGTPADGWKINAEKVGYRLVSVQALELKPNSGARGASQDRVKLKFSRSNAGMPEAELDISNNSANYRFKVRNIPTPSC